MEGAKTGRKGVGPGIWADELALSPKTLGATKGFKEESNGTGVCEEDGGGLAGPVWWTRTGQLP